MTYDAADGYLLLVGRSQRSETCGPDSRSYFPGGPWVFENGQWSELPSAGIAPPPGEGALWFDSEANTTLYYEGAENLTGTGCPTTGSELWSYSNGSWSALNFSLLAPTPRINMIVVDDEADQEQVIFGGVISPSYPTYLNDTWGLAIDAGTGTVTFSTTGLPTGKAWTVAVGSTVLNVTGGNAVFHEPAGTYPYLVAGPAGYRVSGLAPTGSVTIAGAPVELAFHLTKGATYKLTFREKGLPPGQPWCLVLGWHTCTASTARTLTGLTPGIYPYSVSPLPGQAITVSAGGSTLPPSGFLRVSGRSITVVGSFSSRYSVVFSETGLPSGTSWSVKVGATTVHSKTNEIVFELASGTYRFKVGTVRGYERTPTSGMIAVNGTGLYRYVDFSPAPPRATGLGSPGLRVGSGSLVLAVVSPGRSGPPLAGEP